MSRYQAPPPQFGGGAPSIWDTAKKFAMQKGMQAAASGMGGPQGALAGEFLRMASPALGFAGGGKAPLGGGQTKKGLEEARQMGALTQAEFLKAMAHGGYLNKGGKVAMGPLASLSYKNAGGEVYERKYHNPLAGGSSDSKEK